MKLFYLDRNHRFLKHHESKAHRARNARSFRV